MTVLNVAVAGVGALGRHHARILAGMDGVNLVAVADRNEGAASASPPSTAAKPWATCGKSSAKSTR